MRDRIAVGSILVFINFRTKTLKQWCKVPTLPCAQQLCCRFTYCWSGAQYKVWCTSEHQGCFEYSFRWQTGQHFVIRDESVILNKCLTLMSAARSHFSLLTFKIGIGLWMCSLSLCMPHGSQINKKGRKLRKQFCCRMQGNKCVKNKVLVYYIFKQL